MKQNAHEEMKQIFSSDNEFQTMLDFEAALAAAQATLGIIPHEAAKEIQRVAKVENLDKRLLEETIERVHHPIVAFIRVVQALCKGNAGQYVHFGVTSQDVQDTAFVMRLKQAYGVLFRSLRRIEDDALKIAEKYADTIMAGRSHFIHALPITFGFKMAIWAREIRRSIQRLQESYDRVLVGHVSGGVGTMAGFGEKGPELEKLVLETLGVGRPDICWQQSRDRTAEFANLLAIIAGSMGRFAKQVCLLMSTEVAEVAEPWQIGVTGSSTMAHKRNPSLSEKILPLTKKVRYNAALVTEVMVVEHERDLNFMYVEMSAITESLINIGELLTATEDLVKGLVVFPNRMARNLDALKGLIVSESIMLKMGKKIGKQASYNIIYENAMKTIDEGVSFKEMLLKDNRVIEHFSEGEIEQMLDPKNYVGLAGKLTMDAVNLSRKERELDRQLQ